MDIKQIFLESIRDEVWSENNCKNHEKLREKSLFPLRFHPQNVQSDFITHQDIARKMAKLPQFNDQDLVSSIGCYIGKVVKDLYNQYETEIKASNLINVTDLFTHEKGKKGAWENIYTWLWGEKYPQWLSTFQANLWELISKDAQKPPQWLKFIDEDKLEQINKGFVISENNNLPESQSLIPLNQPTYLYIHLPYPKQYLLLFNRGQNTSFIFSPSIALAPQPFLQETPILLPQINKDAKFVNLKFDATGKEEFLGIVINKQINIDWLINPTQEVPILDNERLFEIWEYLNKNEPDYQVFYQCCEVR